MNNIKTILLIGRTGNGKSTLANILTRTDNFTEGEFAVSETKKVQIGEFIEGGTKYRIIDTVGIGDTKMTIDQVLRKLALMSYSAKDGLSQIFFVTDGKLVEGSKCTYDLLEKVVFDKNITKYTTVVRTRFANFRNEEKCKEEREKMVDNNESLMDLIENCNGAIFVDNPPVDIINDEETSKLNKKRREESRKMVLEHLNSVCQDGIYKPLNLDTLSNMIGEYMTQKEELKKNEGKGMIGRFMRKCKNKLLNDGVTKLMKEYIGKIDPKLEENIEKLLEELKKNKESKDSLKAVNWKEAFNFQVELSSQKN